MIGGGGEFSLGNYVMPGDSGYRSGLSFVVFDSVDEIFDSEGRARAVIAKLKDLLNGDGLRLYGEIAKVVTVICYRLPSGDPGIVAGEKDVALCARDWWPLLFLPEGRGNIGMPRSVLRTF